MKKLDTEKLVAITYENMQRQEIRERARGEFGPRFNLEKTGEVDGEVGLCYGDGDGCCFVSGNIAYGVSAEAVADWIAYCSTDKAVEHILAMSNEIVRLNMEIDKLKRDHK